MIDVNSSPFLAQADPDSLSRVVMLQFQAFYEVLEEPWSIQYCFVCGGQYHSWALTAFGSRTYKVLTHMVFHEKEPKHLAVALSRKGGRVALFCPADISTMLLGHVGGGELRDDADGLDTTGITRNPALFDCVSTSLVSLASYSVAEDTPLEYVCDHSDTTGLNRWVEVMLPPDFEAFRGVNA